MVFLWFITIAQGLGDHFDSKILKLRKFWGPEVMVSLYGLEGLGIRV